MKCTDVANRIDDLVDDHLDVGTAGAVRAHIERCPRCRAELAALTEIERRVAEMPRQIEPPRDLWPGIADHIGRRAVLRGRFGRAWMMAAAAALVVAGSVVAISRLVDRGPVRPPSSAETRLAADDIEVSLARLGVGDAGSARRELFDVLEARRDELSPATREVLEENLRVIDEAMQRIAAALQEDPGSELLMRQLASAYRQQVGLVKRAASLPSDV